MGNKIAILIDGGFLLQRMKSIFRERSNLETFDPTEPEEIKDVIKHLVNGHLEHQNTIECVSNPKSLLYRVFYYDAEPYSERTHTPISKQSIDYSKTEIAENRTKLFELLRAQPNTAVRLGYLLKDPKYAWKLTPETLKNLVNNKVKFEDLSDEDFIPDIRQKTVDTKIGIDIASLTLKRQVKTIILVTGDADFVPAAKLARREGVRIVLDPLWKDVREDLFEHIDGLWSTDFRKYKQQKI